MLGINRGIYGSFVGRLLVIIARICEWSNGFPIDIEREDSSYQLKLVDKSEFVCFGSLNELAVVKCFSQFESNVLVALSDLSKFIGSVKFTSRGHH